MKQKITISTDKIFKKKDEMRGKEGTLYWKRENLLKENVVTTETKKSGMEWGVEECQNSCMIDKEHKKLGKNMEELGGREEHVENVRKMKNSFRLSRKKRVKWGVTKSWKLTKNLVKKDIKYLGRCGADLLCII